MAEVPLIDLDDYEVAVQLDKELNGNRLFDHLCGENVENFNPVTAYFKQEILTANNNIQQSAASSSNRNQQDEVTFDNQQAITVSFKIALFLFC